MRRFSTVLSIAFTLAVIACPLTAQELLVSGVDSEPGMIRIIPLNGEAATSPAKGDVEATALRLKFYVENISKQTIKDVTMSAYVYAEDGQARGFYDFSLRDQFSTDDSIFSLIPGEKKLLYLHTAEFQSSTGDTVVLMPYDIRGSRTYWEIDEVSLDRVGPSLDASDFLQLDAGKHPLDLKANDKCIARCDARQLMCNTSCICGVSSFSCSCSPAGGMNSNCDCFQCPP